MFRHQIGIWLLLASASRTGECRVMTGPDGLCAFVRLEPARGDLRVGSTLRVRVNGLDCERGFACDCGAGRHRVRWWSTAPDVASVDSTGLVWAEHAGRADIHLESADGAEQPTAGMHVVVTP
jgi:uncharacterized protein YjdB